MALELYPHQIKALGEIRNGSVLTGGVGTGKSRTALAYYYEKDCGGTLRVNGKGSFGQMERPKDIYVVTTAKKRDHKDWEGEATPFSISTVRESSFNGVRLFVDSWNNIPNHVDVKGAFFVFDEQRLVGTGAWVKAFLKIAKNNHWIMLSATPGDSWIEYAPLFIAHGWYKNRTDFVNQHVVFKPYSKFPKIDRYVDQWKLAKYRQQILVEMPYARHTKRHLKQIIVDHNKVLYDKVVKDRWHIYEDRPLRDVGELFIVVRKLVNSDVSRIAATMEILEKHPKLIIFYNFDYELMNLRTLANTLDYPVAEWNGHKHQEIPETDKWIYLVQYTAGAEGWNCTATDAMLFYSLNYSYKINEQAQGRTDRLNTPYTNLWYYYLRSASAIDQAINKAIVTKKNFNEKEFMEW